MADDDDDDKVADDAAYDLTTATRPAEDTAASVMMQHSAMRAGEGEDGSTMPEWALRIQNERERQRRRLTGWCTKFSGGWGFIARDDGQADVYVHQKHIRRKGFRSLLVGERVEFEVGAKEDGRLQALDVTGPGGVEVQGAPRPGAGEESDSDDGEGAGAPATAGGPIKRADEKKPVKPYTAFKPRSLARPKPAAPPKPKPKP